MLHVEPATVAHLELLDADVDAFRAEFGYAIAPVYRKQGHETSAARAFVDIARADGLRTVVDPDEGPVWRWELAL